MGLFLDGRAHATRPLESFFTPWHLILYSGFAAGAAWTGWILLRARRSGGPLRDALPRGFGLTLMGVVGFAIAGLGDLGWHTAFGIEASIEALLSPTHLLLLVSGALMLTSPLRAAWAAEPADDPKGSRRLVAAVLSMTVTTALLAFFFQYLSAFEHTDRITGAAGGEETVILALASIFVTNTLLVGALLLLVGRFGRLPLGTATLLFGAVAAAVVLEHGTQAPEVVAAALAGGIAADLLLRMLRPSLGGPQRLWLAGGLIPVVLWSAYFAALALTRGVAWAPELWSGAIALAGLIGLGLAFIQAPSLSPPAGTAGQPAASSPG